ncbi:protein shank isoform X5 [Macrobrachium rosenbergii]|uniref:protein shank isoform X5 n=1 Tax=Macrobrachium rosenbergii TaxID=79674 RepID=UPI0034D61BF6
MKLRRKLNVIWRTQSDSQLAPKRKKAGLDVAAELWSRSVVMEDGASVSSASGSAGAGSSSASSVGEEVVLRINVPELKVEKCLQFHKDDLVWDVKQQALAALPKVALWYRELRESFNYGLFCPPQNGRAGKFLDEERPLGDYPLATPIGYLELKYKRRVYKMLHLEEKALRALHTRANLRRFLDYVKENNVEKVSKMCAKGLDPNFHCQDTGETPLSLAARIKKPSRMMMSMVNGGALLDYRTKDGVTAMHRAVQANNFEAVKTLLDLGASPNYRDSRGLTPLYYSVTHCTDPLLCEALLHDYAVIGAADNQGWQETHQACRNKLVQHLEHLLFYGADMNAQNASGNTPLHVCAVNNLEDCARVLLFRGCDKNALNYANQTPYQVAVIAGNMELGEVIKNHNLEDVVPFKEPPKYNPNRRISGAPLSRTHSDPRLDVCAVTKPPSPSPSSRSIPPFSSASSLSETSTGSSSTCTHPSEMDSEECASALGSASLNAAGMDCCDMVSDSSGVCTSNSGSAESYDATPTDVTQFEVGMLVVCLHQYTPHKPGHLDINAGDILEVTGSTDDGMLEGTIRGVSGVFPPQCVQEVRLRNPQAIRESLIAPQVARVQGRREMMVHQHYGTAPRLRKTANEPRTVVLHRGKKGFGFVLRGAKATSPLMERPNERGPALQYLDDVDPGGVADLAGLKKGDYLLKINGEDVSQASHEHVVTLIRKSGDLVQMMVVTPTPVTFLPHKPPIGNLGTIRRGCQTLPRKLHAVRSSQAPPAPPPRDPRTTLSVGRARAKSMVAGLQDIEALDASMRENGDLMSRSACQFPSGSPYGASPISGSQYGTPQGTPTLGTPVGTLKLASIKARPSSKRMTANEVEDILNQSSGSLPSSPPTTPTGRPPRVYASVAEMKKAKQPLHTLEGLGMSFKTFFQPMFPALKARQALDLSRLHKDYHSTPDLKVGVMGSQAELTIEEKRKSVSQEDLFVTTLNERNSRHSLACPPHRSTMLERTTAQSPESKDSWQSGEEGTEEESSDSPNCSPGSMDYRLLRRSQSAVNSNMLRKAGLHPPPTHPPPPPPLGQLVKVDISRSKSDYAAVGLAASTTDAAPLSPGVQSSFRPTDCAKLYASPEEIKAVGYRSPDMMAALNRKNGTAKTRSQSLPPSTNRPSVQKGSPEKETSLDSGIYSTTYSTFRGTEGETKVREMTSPTCAQKAPISDAVTYARPKNNKSVQEQKESCSPNKAYTGPGSVASSVPDIPEPDYSSDEDHTYNSQDDSQSKKTRTLKKKKQSVDFSPNLVTSISDPSDIPHYAAPSKNPTPLNSNFKDLIAQKAAERQARQDDGSDGSKSMTSSPVKKVNGENGNGKAISDAIQESALFNRQKEKTVPSGTKAKPVPALPRDDSKSLLIMKNSQSCPNDFNIEDGDNSSSGVSSDQDVHPESSYVTVINTESDTISGSKNERFARHGARDDSSEASESSDEASDRTWILTNEKGDKSDSSKDSDSNGARRTGTLTRNAVSLVKLPPPQESTEPDLDTELDASQSRNLTRSVDQDTISTLSSLSSLSSGSGSTAEREIPHHHHASAAMQMRATLPRMPHAATITRGSSVPPASQAIKSTMGGTLNRSRSASRDPHWGAESEPITVREKSAPPSSRASAGDRNAYKKTTNVDTGETEYERSIEESLQLIRMHMDSLNEVNTLAGVPAREQAAGEMVLAPPPEFCDMSLAESQNKRNKTVIQISNEDYDPSVRILGNQNSGESDNVPGFRNKTLTEWTTRDTTEWLESIFMPEYKDSFEEQDIDGRKLMGINNDTLINLGVRRVGHRVNMEKSLKRYKPTERIDL